MNKMKGSSLKESSFSLNIGKTCDKLLGKTENRDTIHVAGCNAATSPTTEQRHNCKTLLCSKPRCSACSTGVSQRRALLKQQAANWKISQAGRLVSCCQSAKLVKTVGICRALKSTSAQESIGYINSAAQHRLEQGSATSSIHSQNIATNPSRLCASG